MLSILADLALHWPLADTEAPAEVFYTFDFSPRCVASNHGRPGKASVTAGGVGWCLLLSSRLPSSEVGITIRALADARGALVLGLSTSCCVFVE